MPQTRNKHSRKMLIAAAFIVAGIGACDKTANSPTRPSTRALSVQRAAAPAGGSHIPMLDELFAMVNSQAPGFAGMYRSGQSGITILVTAKGNNAQIEQVVRSVFHELDWQNVSAITFKPAQWEVSELQGWHRRLPEAVASSALIWSDFDEVHNVIRVGVSEISDLAAMSSSVSAIGAPVGAIIFQHSKPFKSMQLLTASHRPTVGGVMISLSDTLNRKFGAAMGQCTLNSNVRETYDTAHEYFITAGHCSDDPVGVFANLGAVVYQPDSATNPTPIGTEYFIPNAWVAGGTDNCPVTLTCKYSDAAVYQYSSKSLSNFGYLARDSSFSSTLGVHGSAFRVDSFHVDSEVPEAYLLASDTATCNTFMHKVGWRTGWTFGCVVKTCYTIYYTTKALTCQYNVAAESDGGDSGSPVFMWVSPGVNQAWLGGLLTGGFEDDYYSFSSIAGMHNDLGGTFVITH